MSDEDEVITYEDLLDLVADGKLPIVAVDADSVALLWWQPPAGQEGCLFYKTSAQRAVFTIECAVYCREQNGMQPL